MAPCELILFEALQTMAIGLRRANVGVHGASTLLRSCSMRIPFSVAIPTYHFPLLLFHQYVLISTWHCHSSAFHLYYCPSWLQIFVYSNSLLPLVVDA